MRAGVCETWMVPVKVTVTGQVVPLVEAVTCAAATVGWPAVPWGSGAAVS
ncbi:hypothetical protein ACIBG7_29300 [Nonomuraea sp. NPDC050328]